MEIHWVHAGELEPAEREAAEARLRSLAEGHQDLIDVRLVAKTTAHHRHGAQEIRIVCQARGTELVAKRERDELGAALNEALDDFEREVRRMRSRRRDRRTERPARPPHLGVVDRVLPERGCGFVLTDAGERVYFHRNAVQGGLRFESLDEGQRVGLNYEGGDEGLQATAILPPPPDAPSP